MEISKMKNNGSRVRTPEYTNRFTGEELNLYPTAFSQLSKCDGKNVNEKVLEEKRDKFLGTCPICKTKLQYHGGNVLSCPNERCKGRSYKTEIDGKETVVYRPIYRIVSESYGSYGDKLFN